MRSIAVIFGVLVLLTGCASKQAELKAIDEAVQSLVLADNSGDAKAAAACYTEDVMWLPPDKAPRIGRAAIESAYRSLFASNKLELELDIEERYLSGKFAYVRGVALGRLTPKDSGSPRQFADDFLMVLRLDAQQKWKVSRLLWKPR